MKPSTAYKGMRHPALICRAIFATILAALAVALIIALVIATPAQAAPPDGYAFKNLTQALQTAKAEAKPMLLYFGRYGCSTCRKMSKEVFTDAALAARMNADFALAYVDTESGRRIRLPSGERATEQQFATRSILGAPILGTPTFVYYDAAQQPLFKKAGFQSIERMREYARYVAGGHYRAQSLAEYMAAR